MLLWATPSVSTHTRHAPLSRPTLPSWLARHWAGWLAALASFALYASTAAPGIVTFFDDTLEFQTVAPTFGIAHPTGYPLYTLLGGLWTRAFALLFPSITWAGWLNLFSAFCAALAVGLITELTSRLTPHRDGTSNRWAGITAATTYALGPVWWNQATAAEVYALHGLFVAAILATTSGIANHSHVERRIALMLLLFGLGLTHHRTTLLLVPPVALYLLWGVPKLWRTRLHVWIGWGVALILPLILYTYIPLRAAVGVRDLNGSYVPTWEGFWDHMLARQYTAFFADNTLAATLTPTEWLALVVAQMGWLALILAVPGLMWLGHRSQLGRAWWLITGALLTNLLFALLYRVPDPEVFLLPSLLCLTILSGGGVGWLMRHLPNRTGSLLALLIIVTVVLLPVGRGPATNRRDDWAAHDAARRMAQANFPADSRVIGLEGEMTALHYMAAAEGLGTAATPITANDPAARARLVAEWMGRGAPVYLTREVEGIATAYSFSGDADLVRVWPRGEAQIALPPPDEIATFKQRDMTLPLLVDGGRVQIEAIMLHPIAGLAQPAHELTLYWRVFALTDKTLKLSLRLLDANGAPYLWPDGRVATEDRFPLHQVALTPAWLPGELVQDVYTVSLPPSFTPTSPQNGLSTLLVIIYDSATAMEENRIEIMF